MMERKKRKRKGNEFVIKRYNALHIKYPQKIWKYNLYNLFIFTNILYINLTILIKVAK